MSRTNISLSDIPKYIKDMLPRLHLSKTREYTWKLYGKHKCGHESQLETEADKLVNFAKRFYADAEITETNFWYDAFPAEAGESWKTRRTKAYRQGFRNSVEIRITDPVARMLEKALQLS
ncbi:MAG: hypothetical protein J6N51_12115 [Selenomonas sp.]|nr:hypothetical protein [Selenomonas sp.]